MFFCFATLFLSVVCRASLTSARAQTCSNSFPCSIPPYGAKSLATRRVAGERCLRLRLLLRDDSDARDKLKPKLPPIFHREHNQKSSNIRQWIQAFARKKEKGEVTGMTLGSRLTPMMFHSRKILELENGIVYSFVARSLKKKQNLQSTKFPAPSRSGHKPRICCIRLFFFVNCFGRRVADGFLFVVVIFFAD